MRKKDNTEVAKIDPKQYPKFMGSVALGKGHEDPVDSSAFTIPRAKLIQHTAEEVTAENPEDRIEPGKLINSITKAELPLLFIPIYRYRSFFKYNSLDKHSPDFNSEYEPGDLIFSTTDKNDPRIGNGLEFGEDGKPPAVTECWNYLALFPGESMPLILSFKRTSIRAARDLNTMLQISGGAMFSSKFRIVISSHAEGQKKWFTISCRGAGKSTTEELAIADAIFEQFRGKGPSVAATVEEHAAPENKDADWKE